MCLPYTRRVPDAREPFRNVVGCEWDAHNAPKIRQRHRVEPRECEEVFGRQPLFVTDDLAHSGGEPRWLAFGRSATGRRLLVVFTVRRDRLRVISARDMSRRERRQYEEACERALSEP
jgi:uncharacterized DUF497 family protein